MGGERAFSRPGSWWRTPALLAGLALAGAAGNGARAAEPSPTDLQAVEQELKREEAERARLDREAQATEREAKALAERMVAAARRIQDQEETLSALESRLAALGREEKALSTALSRRDDQVVRVLTAVQRLAWRPTEALLVQPAPPADTVRVAIMLRQAIPRIRDNARTLAGELVALHNIDTAIRAQRAQIRATGDALRAEHAALLTLSETKRTLAQDLRAKGQAAEERMGRLARDAQDLRDLLARLEAEKKAREEEARLQRKREEEERQRREREEAERRALIAQHQKPPSPIVAAPRLEPAPTIEEVPDTGFERARGRMPFPARGRLVGAYGERTELGGIAKGLRIATRSGAQVVAPYEGVVAFAGPFKGYGNLLIIDHGGGYHTLLAGLGRIDGVVGQRLTAGEPVGVMPAADGSGDTPALYVEMRRKGQPINPLPWLTASKGNASG
ncbi:murein hydrolase activator EnvC family protein [Pararhodospirillum photometricum]|uniref:Peptidase M23B n=1 Tax=Pararhodospirillum photometricum DSM 122 TaxID=1150469 RepID=H6SL25_PARPM|nr:peptidoglycan DD-metalloendopeptidase family protein [Pararhodospirillum photometricum]CCG08690.1 Peptidase M23B [Pararhodospirillum photometricum DSM 122]